MSNQPGQQRCPRLVIMGVSFLFGLAYILTFKHGKREIYVVPPVPKYMKASPKRNITTDRCIPVLSSSPGVESTNKKLCSQKMLDDRMRQVGSFYADGYWLNKDKKKFLDYRPAMCNFADSFRQKQRHKTSALVSCLKQKQVKYILVSGDSHGGRYFNATLALFTAHNFTCVVKREEQQGYKNGTIIKDYYARVLGIKAEELVVSKRTMSHGGGQLHYCVNKNGKNVVTVQVEYLAWNFILDSTISFLNLRTRSAPTTQELFFRYYMRKRKRVDLVVLAVPLMHELRSGLNSWEQVEINLNYFADLLRVHVLPKGTDIYWIPTGRHFATDREKFPPVYKGLTAAKQFRKMTESLFKTVRKLKNNYPEQIFSYFDSVALSCKFRGLMADPGIHFIFEWYYTVMYQIFQLWCL